MDSLKHVKAFLVRSGFDLICRTHLTGAEGYEFPFALDRSLLTLFSAPCYPADVRCRGAVMMVDEGFLCNFTVTEPVDWEMEVAAKVVHQPGLKFEPSGLRKKMALIR
jgi:hypothetical protein